jgi:hypothetical protein
MDNWQEYTKYIESCPKELTEELSAQKCTSKWMSAEQPFKKRLSRDIRNLVSSIIPSSDPSFSIILGSAEAISQSETNKIGDDPQCQKRFQDAWNKMQQAYYKYVEKHANEITP